MNGSRILRLLGTSAIIIVVNIVVFSPGLLGVELGGGDRLQTAVGATLIIVSLLVLLYQSYTVLFRPPVIPVIQEVERLFYLNLKGILNRAAIHKQSLETSISVDTLKQAFSDVLSALDSISTYKQEALPKMRDTIHVFREMADTGEQQIKRLERGQKLGL